MRDQPSATFLGDGLGLKACSESDKRNKPLHMLSNSRDLLLHDTDCYRAFGIEEFILCLGHGSWAIKPAALEGSAAPAPRGAIRVGSPHMAFGEGVPEAPRAERVLAGHPYLPGSAPGHAVWRKAERFPVRDTIGAHP